MVDAADLTFQVYRLSNSLSLQTVLNEAFSESKDKKNAYSCGPWLEAVFTYIRKEIWSPSQKAPFDESVIDAVDWTFQVDRVSKSLSTEMVLNEDFSELDSKEIDVVREATYL